MQVSSLANVSVMSVVCGQYHCIVLDEEHRCDGLMGSNRGPVVEWGLMVVQCGCNGGLMRSNGV